ncbi:MAG: UDP-N-acetylmuramate--L-alanine ligase [Spirochaetota bacterium]
MFAEKQKIHFIGIGGIGMSGIARILLSMGYKVSGSDLHRGDVSDALARKGAHVFEGHARANVMPDVALVVTSSAIRPDNPEIAEARKRGIVIIHRSEMLAELMRLRYGIAISGTHGKTTTTSLVSHLLTDAGLKPTSVIGGKYFNINSNANFGTGRYLVCEADESDGSFLRLSPVIAVVTNIDNDHLDHYKTETALAAAFTEFVNSVPFYGSAFLCFEDKAVRKMAAHVNKRYYRYGFDKEFDIAATKIRRSGAGCEFSVTLFGKDIGEFHIPLFGDHNILNTLAAIGVASSLKVKPDRIRRSLTGFAGVGRRLNLVHDGDIRVFDDYGHHPTEIKATLAALKQAVSGRLVVVFQPHRYSRTAALYRDFGKAFGKADSVIVTDIYPAGEKPMSGVNGKLIYKELVKNGVSVRFASRDDVVSAMHETSKNGDTVLTLGAGDIYKAGERFVSGL